MGIAEEIKELQQKVKQLEEQKAKLIVGFTEPIHSHGDPLPGMPGHAMVSSVGKVIIAIVSKCGFAKLSAIALVLAFCCFGCVIFIPFNYEDNTLNKLYYTVCIGLYAVWTMGVPVWFFLEYYYLCNWNYRLFDRFKHLQDLSRAVWLSIAVMLAVLFWARTNDKLPNVLGGKGPGNANKWSDAI